MPDETLFETICKQQHTESYSPKWNFVNTYKINLNQEVMSA